MKPPQTSAHLLTSSKALVARLGQLTGKAAKALENQEEGKIPGGRGCVMEEAQARALVQSHHAEFLALGGYLFFSRDLARRNGPLVALLPTRDQYQAVAAVGTEGANSKVYTPDLINWLQEVEREQPFEISAIGSDFIEGRFTGPLADPVGLAHRINQLCPDGDEGPEADQALAVRLQQTGRFLLWWD